VQPTFFALIAVVFGSVASTSGVLTMQVIATLFGGAAAITLTGLGGAPINPAMMCVPFLVARAWKERRPGQVRRLGPPSQWFAALVLYAAVSAYFMPRLFEGELFVYAIDRGAGSAGVALSRLRPVTGNLTQTAYLTADFVCFVTVRALLARPGRMLVMQHAVLWLAGLDCLAAILNLAQHYAGFPPVLDLFRNASYKDFAGVESAGLVRIQGTFHETSGFSAFTIPLFAFVFSLWQQGAKPVLSGVLAFLTLTFLLISTSGTAYVGLAGYGSYLLFTFLWHGLSRRGVPRLAPIVLALTGTVLLAGAIVIFAPSVYAKIEAFFQYTALNKLDSASGIERGMWNRQALQNFLDTYGLGVGTGTVRTSSYPVTLLAGVGVVGFGLFCGFFYHVLRARSKEHGDASVTAEAARQAIISILAPLLSSGGLMDLGICTFILCATATSVPTVREVVRRTGQRAMFSADSVFVPKRTT
jgi:hypothetical protein